MMGHAMNHRCLVPILAVAVAFIAGPTRAGLLYVVQNDNVYSYDVSLGNASAVSASRQTVLEGSPYLNNARGIVFDSAGNLYVLSGSSSVSMAMFSTSGQYQYNWALGTGVYGIAYGPAIVPEPSTYATALGGMAVVGWHMLRGRRRRDQAASSPR